MHISYTGRKLKVVADKPPLFTRLAYLVLAINVAVVVWGAYVRASGSGAGCGSHWPLCNGEVVPVAPAMKTVIEFAHRLTSGLALIGVAGLWLYSRRVFTKDAPARRAAGWSLLFILLEALLGAGLVLFRYVEHDASVARALYLSAHLANTLVLLAFLTAAAWLSHRSAVSLFGRKTPWEWAALAAVLIVSITGAVTALGDTLFPAESFRAGVQAELSASAHVLQRLRIVHPALAIGAALVVVIAALRPAGRWVIALLVLQVLIGAANVLMAAPVPLQLLHLFSADLLWIALVMLQLDAGHGKLVP